MIQASQVSSELNLLRTQGVHAVVELFNQYKPRLSRIVVLRLDPRILGKIDAEDILQDIFVEASRRSHDFMAKPSVPFFVWLRQLTCQILVDVHRRYLGARKRDASREVSLDQRGTDDASSAYLVTQLADSLTSPSQRAVRNEAVIQLRSVLQDLKDSDREVLVLRHLEELSNDEVAAVLGIDKAAASKRYIRALARLKTAMSDNHHP